MLEKIKKVAEVVCYVASAIITVMSIFWMIDVMKMTKEVDENEELY